MDGSCVCVAMTMQYILANKNNGELTELFPYESEQSIPLVKRVGKVRMFDLVLILAVWPDLSITCVCRICASGKGTAIHSSQVLDVKIGTKNNW